MFEKVIQGAIIIVFLVMTLLFIIGSSIQEIKENDPYDVTCEFEYTSSGRFGIIYGTKKVPCRLTSDHISSEE